MIYASEIFCLNEQGKRQNNEDNISPAKGKAITGSKLFVVCDGVGGESKGEIASEIVCSSIERIASNFSSELPNEKELLEKAIAHANNNLMIHASEDVSARRMSSTLSAILLGQNSVVAAWCGDTRIHHIRNGEVIWKSKDHSLVAELIENGEINEEEAKAHPRKNIITRSLNAGNTNNKVDYHEITNIREDDYFLLCTDGLMEQMSEDRIAKVLTSADIKDKANGFNEYCRDNTNDNYSMYLIRIGTKKTVSSPVPPKKSIKGMLFLSLLLMSGLIVLFVLMNGDRKIQRAKMPPQKKSLTKDTSAQPKAFVLPEQMAIDKKSN